MTISKMLISNLIQVRFNKLTILKEEYRLKNPNYFRLYWDGARFSEYCSPEFIEILKKLFPIQEKTPKGWLTPRKISELLNVEGGTRKIAKLAEKYRRSNLEWFKLFLTGPTFCEHYAPSLVAILKELCAPKERAPKVWMTARKISKINSVQGSDISIKKHAETYRKSNPEYFKKYWTKAGYTKHYAPLLVAILKGLCAPKKRAPKGWTTASKISELNEIKSSYYMLKKHAETYRKSNPEFFCDYWNGAMFTEHYSPSLVAILKKLCARK